ncbi:MAG: glycosyltransferase [Acidobacteria bacterium]|jgi:GT2 family glycosyltransferase|nr:glycosyltransferase [Acidobacteriota bacterium]
MPTTAQPARSLTPADATLAPGLTIIVLTHQRRELLRTCLESLFAQDDPGIPLDFVVVVDGSTDGTVEMVRALTAARPRWRCVSQAHRGIAAARNIGIRSSRTALTAIVADDYLLPRGYARAIADFFREQPQALVLRFKVVAAGSGFLGRALHAYQEASVIRRLAPLTAAAGRRGLWRRRPPGAAVTTDHDLEAAGGAAFRSEVFQVVSGFDESFARGEDTEFTRRLHAAGIAVHYQPGLAIGHRNDARLRPALQIAFANGQASWRLCAFPEQKAASVHGLAWLALRSGPAAIYWSCWRAWQTGWPARFLAYWPVLLLLESASRAGFFLAGVRSRRPAARRPANFRPT